MGIYNCLHTEVQCPRCGARTEAIIDLYFGFKNLLEYHLGDIYQWRERKQPQNGGRPDGGNVDGEGYTECAICRKASFWIVEVRSDILQSVRPDPNKQPYDTLIERREHRPYASHHQFYIEDANESGDTSDLSFWTDQTTRDKLALVPGTMGVNTATYGHVVVYSELHDAEPPLNLAEWDHVTEASLEIKSGVLHVIGCLDDTGEVFNVQSCPYRVRCCHANLAGGNDAGDGDDWYLVQFWPAPMDVPVVLKRWEEGVA